MSLSVPGRWIWDFWLAEHDGLHHLFFLQAPTDIVDPHQRHWNVSIGHAVSTDLTTWELRPDALAPAAEPAWDDYTTWTGSVVRHEGQWCMFYTGSSREEGGLVQRVGLAVSDDLDTWRREPGPLIQADDRWYERLGPLWPDEAWRDPWVFRGADGDYHALITARTNSGQPYERGCIAHARSQDLYRWEVRPPLSTPGGFGQMEVPQVHRVGGEWFLVFCSDDETQAPRRRAQGPGTGTYVIATDSPLGPFDAAAARPLQVDRQGSRYAGRLVERDGPMLLSWSRLDPHGRFVGALADPVPVARNGAELTVIGG
jgi:beta-fructofuranosidase